MNERKTLSSGASGNKVTAIIPTAGRKERADSLRRAVESIEQQNDVQAQVLLVFNGPSIFMPLVQQLQARDSVTVAVLDEGNLPKAINFGRRCVDTDYFCFLDDDDEYLPDALAIRCQILDENRDIDVVVTNGLVRDAEKSWKLLPDKLSLDWSPIEELFRRNWLASCGGLYRSSTVDAEYFRIDSKYYEWTMTAFLLSLDRSVKYLNKSTFVINKTDDSLSASLQYLEAYPNVLQLMRQHSSKRWVNAEIKRRLARSYHALSVAYQHRRNRREAWRYHLHSLMSIYGLRYFPYTARLVSGSRPSVSHSKE